MPDFRGPLHRRSGAVYTCNNYRPCLAAVHRSWYTAGSKEVLYMARKLTALAGLLLMAALILLAMLLNRTGKLMEQADIP